MQIIIIFQKFLLSTCRFLIFAAAYLRRTLGLNICDDIFTVIVNCDKKVCTLSCVSLARILNDGLEYYHNGSQSHI